MKRINMLLIILASASILVSGCKGAKEKKPADNSKVVATVNGEKITQADIDAELAGKPDSYLKAVNSPEGRKMMIDRMVERKLLMQTAKKEGVSDSSDIEKKIAAYKERLVIEELRKKIVAAPGQSTDQQALSYYNEHKLQYNTPDMARVRRIIVSDKAAADKIYKELKAAPALFEPMAKESSEDEFTKSRGGDMGFVMKTSDAQARMKTADPASLQRNTIPDDIAVKVFAMKKDEISPVFPYQGKFYIYQLLEKRPGEEKSFDEVKEQVKRVMDYEGTQNKWKEYIDGLKKTATIQITDQGAAGGTSGAVEVPRSQMPPQQPPMAPPPRDAVPMAPPPQAPPQAPNK